MSYLDRRTQLIICQLAGSRAGQAIRDLHRLHGRDVGREFRDRCAYGRTDVHRDEALHQVRLGTQAWHIDASRDHPSGTGRRVPLPPRLLVGSELPSARPKFLFPCALA